MNNPRTTILSSLIQERNVISRPRILVVGCGRGIEAAVLAQHLGAEVTGIDLYTHFDPEAARIARLIHGDATALAFEDETFDIVYSYHVLEHIPDYHKALDEMYRVLRNGGLWCIGTPNRARLIGYVGGCSTWRQKLAWNLADWRMRLAGRFRNEYGAHAGYTSRELGTILKAHFSTVEEVTEAYYRRLYAHHESLIAFMIASGIGQFLFPSVYFMGRR